MSDNLNDARVAILDAIERAAHRDESGEVAQLTQSYHLLLCGGPVPQDYEDEILDRGEL